MHLYLHIYRYVSSVLRRSIALTYMGSNRSVRVQKRKLFKLRADALPTEVLANPTAPI